jgi:predicted amidohydrolase
LSVFYNAQNIRVRNLECKKKEMKKNLKIATAQFENKSGDKSYNLGIIKQLAAEAAQRGAQVIAFHECCVNGYSFARHLSREQLQEQAELIPQGPSTAILTDIAKEYDIVILAGLFEKDEKGDIFKAQICVDKSGLKAKHRKLHPFINPNVLQGNSYTVFELFGWKCGILICYDNNVIENVRATTLLGAEIIFMPHVTMCTPSTRPGAGFVDSSLWLNKEANKQVIRNEFDGPKGREWLMKWLPARAYDNAIYAIFSNPIGMDDDQLKNGCSMVIDPYGDIMAECRSLENELVIAELSADKLILAGGYRYLKARRPELYREILGKDHRSEQKVVWM